MKKIGRTRFINHEYDYRLNWTTRSPVSNKVFKMIGSRNCPIADELVQITAVYAPITFEEIVMIVIT